MDENKKHISDELLACYLEGKVTDEEKALVEASLAEDGETMDDLMLTRTEMAYSEMIKRLVGEGILLDEKIQRRRKIRLYVTGLLVLALVAAASFWIWRLSTPLHVRVNVIEDQAYSIPNLPFEKGVLHCEYADNAVQTVPIGTDNTTVSLDDIPYKYRKSPVHLVFEADGYQTIDTVVPVQKTIALAIRRTNELGVVFGSVIDYKTGQPVANATVRLQDLETMTDDFGQFRIDIPFEKQDKAQLVRVFGEGYPLWEGYYRPSATDPWTIMLGENQ